MRRTFARSSRRSAPSCAKGTGSYLTLRPYGSRRFETIRGIKDSGPTCAARLGTARIAVQVDFGFGNAVTSVVDEERLPTLIGGVPAPLVRTYPRVATIAEKFETMVQLGTRNSRMKDFYDIWALSETFAFYGTELREAVGGCFERRGTAWTPAVPEALTSAFYSDADLQVRWQSYGQDGQLLSSPPSAFEDIGDRNTIISGTYTREHSVRGVFRDALARWRPLADVGFIVRSRRIGQEWRRAMNGYVLSIDRTDAETAAIIRERHAREFSAVEAALNEILRGLSDFGSQKLKPDNRLESARLFLATRSFNSLRTAVQVLERGYYQQAMGVGTYGKGRPDGRVGLRK